MNDTQAAPRPGWFAALAIVALIWNLLGVMAFIMQVTMSPEALAALSEPEQELYRALPTWALAAFGAAVIGGALGCLALAIRSRFAVPLLAVSLLGVAAQMTYSFFLSKTFEVYGPGGMVMPIMIVIVAVFLLWLAIHAGRRGWLR